MGDQATWRKNLPEGFDGRHGDGKEWDSEVPLKPIMWSTVAIVISLSVALGFCWALIGFLESNQPEVELSPIAEANERRLPPRPWIQPKPELELDEYLAEIDEIATSYGWVDALDERVHIPIDRAVELVLADRGMSTTSPEPTADPVVDADVETAINAGDEPQDAAAHGEPHG